MAPKAMLKAFPPFAGNRLRPQGCLFERYALVAAHEQSYRAECANASYADHLEGYVRELECLGPEFGAG
jgi:hypothetical protein